MIIVQFPVDLNRGDCSVRENGRIGIQIECQSTDKCCVTVACSRIDVILVDVVAICQTVDELKYRKIRKQLIPGSDRTTCNLLDRWPRNSAKMQLNSNSIVWKKSVGHSRVAWLSGCNCKWCFERFPSQGQTASTAACPANEVKRLYFEPNQKYIWVECAPLSRMSHNYVYDRTVSIAIAQLALTCPWLDWARKCRGIRLCASMAGLASRNRPLYFLATHAASSYCMPWMPT